MKKPLKLEVSSFMASSYIHTLTKEKPEVGSNDSHTGEAHVSAHPITQKVAKFYEKIRSLIDYQDEGQIKRRIIERIIKRKLLFLGQRSIGESIVEELVGAGYLPNDIVPESKAKEIQSIVEKYKAFSSDEKYNTQGFRAFTTSLAASEVHEFLFPYHFENNARLMFAEILRDTISFDVSIDSRRKERLFLLATSRVLFESSVEDDVYLLWKHAHTTHGGAHLEVMSVAQAFDFFEKSKSYVEDSLVWVVANRIKDMGVSVRLLYQFAKEYEGAPGIIFSDTKQVAERLKGYLETHYKQEKSYVKKSGIRAVIYLLFTKIIIALIIEVPIDLWLAGSIAFGALIFNVVFHPLMLLFITRRSLGFDDTNTKNAISGALRIIENQVPKVFIKTKSNSFYETMYFFLYGLLYAVSFGIIVGVLRAIHFNFISIILFLVFLALVSYFAVRIRGHALRYKLSSEKEKLGTMFGNLFMLPVIRLGRLLSTKFSSINALVFIMDFIVETPFKLLLKIVNNFLYFLKDKKEDVF